MPKPGSAHAVRRARTRRRFAAIATLTNDAQARIASVAAAQPLVQALVHTLGWDRPSPFPSKALLTPQQLKAEFDLFRVGQRRKAGRRPKPVNSNDPIVGLLRKHRPDDFKGRFTAGRAEDTRLWLARRKIYKSAEAITKLVNRAKHPKPR